MSKGHPQQFNCRKGCGACCIAPSIRSALPGMPGGKAAGQRCVNLNAQGLCRLWGSPDYPPLCRAFLADPQVCGASRSEALRILERLEQETAP